MADRSAKRLISSIHVDPLVPRGCTLIAFEVRPRNLGFVVFEKPTQLLDWGVREASRGKDFMSTVASRIELLFDQYRPRSVVLRQREDHKARANKDLPLVLSEIAKCAEGRSIRLCWMQGGAVKDLFAPYGYKTRFEIASAIVELFEELSWKLPRKRKPWQNDKPNMLIFDAAGLGLAYFASCDTIHEQRGL